MRKKRPSQPGWSHSITFRSLVSSSGCWKKETKLFWLLRRRRRDAPRGGRESRRGGERGAAGGSNLPRRLASLHAGKPTAEGGGQQQAWWGGSLQAGIWGVPPWTKVWWVLGACRPHVGGGERRDGRSRVDGRGRVSAPVQDITRPCVRHSVAQMCHVIPEV